MVKAAYVVFRGRTPGIYYSWDVCNAQVNGFSGAEFKGYNSRDEAQRVWHERQISIPPPPESSTNIRKRSDSDDGEALVGELRSGGKIPRLQSIEIPDSDEEVSLGEGVPSEEEIHMIHSLEIPDSEDDLSSGDEDWHGSINKPDGNTPKTETEPEHTISRVRPEDVGLGFKEEDSMTVVELTKPWDLQELQFPLTAAQQAVVTMAKNGDNIFLTGAAGSGKTATLREILRCLEKKYQSENNKYPAVQITAPTGIAALPLQGKTTWSFAGWNENSFRNKWENLLRDIKKQTRRTMKSLKVLIIDEISMVENQFLQRLNMYMQHILQSSLPFGGKQVIIVGDFHQLPPVQPFQHCIECGEPTELKLNGPLCTTRLCSLSNNQVAIKWEDKWAFKAPVWEQLKLKHIKLEQIHRQKDTGFVSILNKIRNGIRLTDDEWKELELRKSLPYGVVPIRLMSRKGSVERFNSAQLATLSTESVSWKAQDICRKQYQTDADRTDPLLIKQVTKERQYWLSTLKDHRFQPDLTLKIGAKVLLLYNIAIERGLVNGSQGEVVGFADTTHWPLTVPKGENKKWRLERAKEFHAQNPHRPIVRFANGLQRAIEPITVESMRGRSNDRYLLCRTQIPLTLGWALSIHKSQGMTLDYVELSSKDIFESGQLYVGLSRATRLEGLTVTGFNRKLLDVDEDVLEFYKTAKWVDLGQDKRTEIPDEKEKDLEVIRLGAKASAKNDE